MKSLTGLDATFLYLETPEMPMHVGSFNLCEFPAGFKGSFHKAVKTHIASRMHLAPIFSRKLVAMPFDLGHPLWVEAESVDIGFHVRRVPCSAQKPMTLAQAHTVVARLHSELIDRSHPLWEFYVFDAIKLPSGERVAGFFSKIHHAALDGKGGVMLANAMLDMGPVPREVAPPDPARRRHTASGLTAGKMIGSVFSSSLGQLAKLARSLPAAAGTLARQTATGAAGGARPRMKLAPPTPFNTGISPDRVFVTATLPLAECKAMGKAVGGSLNDLLLWICSTALRSYLAQHHSLPEKSLVAAMPVSLREAGASDAAELGNQVSMSLVELGTQIAHPLKRMNAIMASTGKVKTSMQSLKSLLPTDYPSLLAPWLVGGAGKAALNAYGKSGMAGRLPMVANLAISNVPGPPVPLYLAGAKFLSFHPLSIVLHGLALNITIQTYAGQVDFGIVAGNKALPHAQDLVRAIKHAFAQAQALLGEPAAPAPAAAPVKTRKAAVASATSSGKPPSVKRAAGPKISTIRNKTTTPDASSHGTTRSPTLRTSKTKTRAKTGPARRSAA
ncbi:MAG: wax ester/triacylglycerol synthase family O-acyltransferase [Polaromonas sp.]|nr:wax ester/triacylglycerol synthase family O-acyltransferase [Polaromonas sp.]